eukprot:13122899-Alexandrium_andersonii.AAC.1
MLTLKRRPIARGCFRAAPKRHTTPHRTDALRAPPHCSAPLCTAPRCIAPHGTSTALRGTA